MRTKPIITWSHFRCYFKTPNLLLALAGCKWWIISPRMNHKLHILESLISSSAVVLKFWSNRRISGIYSLHLLLKMLQKFEVWKGIVHAVLNQAFSKMMAVLSVLSEIMPRMYMRCDVFNMFNELYNDQREYATYTYLWNSHLTTRMEAG